MKKFKNRVRPQDCKLFNESSSQKEDNAEQRNDMGEVSSLSTVCERYIN
ncbi:hypothetical protein ETA_17110 [Erwinia tasmaniensis Et1/99]|uniref:Uncharacterized protein n=1 Tax=Erwinia tasmaniensis (strain DSM 17950 / CFBP 7177 / CIP 109463 / NCPPB 4357 / Et1/99) TaxID=465817 RepID=B2VKG5_ERWT9|nr:hypothetical protein ETA_17110 [Erwinia tasmaniensis Et1/99]